MGASVQRNDGYFEQIQRRKLEMVTTVQALWRGRQGRNLSALLVEQRKLRRNRAETIAAVRIQALWRGFRVRRMTERHVAMEAAARTVQARWRGHFLRKRMERAIAAAKYLDEDDFDYGDGAEGFLTGLEGLSRPGTGGSFSSLGQRPLVRKHGWVEPVDPTVEIVPRGTPGSGPGSEATSVTGERQLAPPARLGEGSGRNGNGMIRYGNGTGMGSHSAVPVTLASVDPTMQTADRGVHSHKLAPEVNAHSEELRSGSSAVSPTPLERSPLQPIHTSISGPNALELNGPHTSSVVPLPTISPHRSVSQGENAREGRVSLPEIRLSSSQLDPVWRASKRFSEPGGKSSGDWESVRGSNEMTPRQLGDELSTRGSIQSTPRGPHVSKSQKKQEKQRHSISEIAQEWGFKDEATAAAALRSREKLLRNGQRERRQKSLQDPEKRLQIFKAHAKQGPILLPRPSLAKIRPAWAKVRQGSDEDASSDD